MTNSEIKKDCIIFTGYKNKYGYGVIVFNNMRTKAHRLAFKLSNPGISLTKNKNVCHHCDNRSCINPNHLFIGTNGDNNRDRTAKGRSARGERHGMSKLTTDEVKEIKNLITVGEESLASIARTYKVSRRLIQWIKRGECWGYL